jgi:hypothetical protein
MDKKSWSVKDWTEKKADSRGNETPLQRGSSCSTGPTTAKERLVSLHSESPVIIEPGLHMLLTYGYLLETEIPTAPLTS